MPFLEVFWNVDKVVQFNRKFVKTLSRSFYKKRLAERYLLSYNDK